MKSLEEMTIEEIVTGVGIDLDGLGVELAFGHIPQLLKELQELAERDNDTTRRFSENIHFDKSEQYAKILSKYEDQIDKGLLIAYSLYRAKKKLEANPSKTDKKRFEDLIRKYIQMLGKRDFDIVYLGIPLQENQEVRPVRVINSQELIECIRKNRSVQTLFEPDKRKIDKIRSLDEEVDLAGILPFLESNDVKSIVTYSKKAEQIITKQLFTRCWERQYERKQNRDDMTVEDAYEIGKIIKQELTVNSRYIDVDKLFLILAYRCVQMLEKGNVNDIEIYKQVLSLFCESIKKGTKVDIRETEISVSEIYGEDDRIIGEYSLEDLKADMERFVGKRFIRREEIQTAKRSVIIGEKTLGEIDPDVIRFLEFSTYEQEKVLQIKEENVIFLVKGNYVKHDALILTLNKVGKCSDELLCLMVQKNLIDGNEVLSLYNKGIVTLENIQAVLQLTETKTDEPKEEFIKRDDINEIIRQLYLRTTDKENQTIKDDVISLDRFCRLYRLLNIEGKEPEEVKKATNELIGTFEDILDKQLLQRLYQIRLISIDDAIGWGADLNQMLAAGDIKPTDLKRLYRHGTVRYEDIEKVIQGDSITYEDKLDLIYSTFDGKGKEEAEERAKLIELLDTKQGYRNYETGDGTKDRKKREKNPENDKGKEHPKNPEDENISFPCARWHFLSLLDQDYSKVFIARRTIRNSRWA